MVITRAAGSRTVTRRGRVASSTRAAAAMAARVGVALLSMLAVLLLPVEAWGATTTNAVSGWTVVFSGAGPGSFSVATLTLDNGDRGLSAAQYTRQTANIGYAQMNLYCSAPGTSAGSVGQGWSSSLPSGWTSLVGQIGAGSTSTADPYTINSTDASPNGGTQGANLHTNLCPTGTEVRMARFNVWNSGTSSYSEHYLLRGGSATPSTCTTSFTNARAAYIGTTLTVMFGWSGTVPASGWRVHAPGDGWTSSGASSQGTVSRTRATGNAEYDGAFTVSGLTAGTTTVRISSGSDFGCYVVVTAGSVALVNGVPNIGSDPTTGESCSSWDVFCQIRSAFTPSASSLDQWTDLQAEAADVVPFGYVIDALDGFTYLTDGCGIDCDGDKVQAMCFNAGWSGPGTSAEGADVCPFTDDNVVIAWLQGQRAWLGTLAWLAVLGPLVGLVWRRSLPFMSGGD